MFYQNSFKCTPPNYAILRTGIPYQMKMNYIIILRLNFFIVALNFSSNQTTKLIELHSAPFTSFMTLDAVFGEICQVLKK